MHEHIKERIKTVIANLNALPSMPEVVTRIINMVNDPNVDFKLVAEEISRDQAITTNILKIANSAYFSKGKEIASVEKALVTLGMKEVKDIVVVAATKQVLDKPVIGYDLAKGELWKHNVAVAMLAKKIAIDKKKKNLADLVFTGGIIHDVGKTVLAIYVASTFKDLIQSTVDNQITFAQAEQLLLGFDHQEIGQIILKKWQFPESLQNIVRYHHDADDAPQSDIEAVAIVHVANTICQMAGIGIGGDGLYYELSGKAIEATGLDDSELQHYYGITPELLKMARQIM
ncbi:MAG: HDOD domain-containing protein [Spirochaetes bacterium]|nr:HDOD domain-containing protein [Spirochaetota bacterium]MBN2770023.1 HDOD domain-containing protein [Spirochaetota bacterium]